MDEPANRDPDRLQRLELSRLGRPVLSRRDGLAADYLGWYAEAASRSSRSISAPSTGSPSKGMVQGTAQRNRTPDGFRFVLKVPQVITHQKRLQECEEEVDGFVTSILPLGNKLTAALLQLGYFNRGAFPSLDDFLNVLDPFLARWPHDRSPGWPSRSGTLGGLARSSSKSSAIIKPP